VGHPQAQRDDRAARTLPETDARDLLDKLIGPRIDDHAAARILAIAEGNPLFVEEIVAMLIDDEVVGAGQGDRTGVDGQSAMAVPPTIQALIAARLDRLDEGERVVIEAASIEGKEFARDRVEALVDDGRSESLDARLRALIRKDLIRPAGATADTFRLRHQLIRDGAYNGIPKRLRADLHERFAHQLGVGSPAVPVADELLGHHLERAVLLRRELGATEVATAELAGRASTYLRAAGRRLTQREDPAAVRLLSERWR
jgi:predicted ATPase